MKGSNHLLALVTLCFCVSVKGQILEEGDIVTLKPCISSKDALYHFSRISLSTLAANRINLQIRLPQDEAKVSLPSFVRTTISTGGMLILDERSKGSDWTESEVTDDVVLMEDEHTTVNGTLESPDREEPIQQIMWSRTIKLAEREKHYFPAGVPVDITVQALDYTGKGVFGCATGTWTSPGISAVRWALLLNYSIIILAGLYLLLAVVNSLKTQSYWRDQGMTAVIEHRKWGKEALVKSTTISDQLAVLYPSYITLVQTMQWISLTSFLSAPAPLKYRKFAASFGMWWIFAFPMEWMNGWYEALQLTDAHDVAERVDLGTGYAYWCTAIRNVPALYMHVNIGTIVAVIGTILVAVAVVFSGVSKLRQRSGKVIQSGSIIGSLPSIAFAVFVRAWLVIMIPFACSTFWQLSLARQLSWSPVAFASILMAFFLILPVVASIFTVIHFKYSKLKSQPLLRIVAPVCGSYKTSSIQVINVMYQFANPLCWALIVGLLHRGDNEGNTDLLQAALAVSVESVTLLLILFRRQRSKGWFNVFEASIVALRLLATAPFLNYAMQSKTVKSSPVSNTADIQIGAIITILVLYIVGLTVNVYLVIKDWTRTRETDNTKDLEAGLDKKEQRRSYLGQNNGIIDAENTTRDSRYLDPKAKSWMTPVSDYRGVNGSSRASVDHSPLIVPSSLYGEERRRSTVRNSYSGSENSDRKRDSVSSLPTRTDLTTLLTQNNTPVRSTRQLDTVEEIADGMEDFDRIQVRMAELVRGVERAAHDLSRQSTHINTTNSANESK